MKVLACFFGYQRVAICGTCIAVGRNRFKGVTLNRKTTKAMLNKTPKALVMSVIFSAVAATASAVTITYQDIDKPNVLIKSGKSFQGDFDIVTGDGDQNIVISGYTPAATNGTFSDLAGYTADGTLTSASAFFYLRDANQGNDSWDINVDIYDFLNGTGGSLGGNSQYTHTRVFGSSEVAFTFLSNNGHISYTVENTSKNGEFTLEFARLTATKEVLESENTPVSVPDGGMTVALLGFTLTGMAALRRKMAL